MSETPSRPSSPDSDHKLQRASATIDELTRALANFSRATTPDLEVIPSCSCCERDECETVAAWLRDRANVERRLVLSAEVGQALLERHEAYAADHTRIHARALEKISSLQHSNDLALSRMAELIKSNDNSEKRLAQARLNLEVGESSNRALLREIHESRATMNSLVAQVARSTGWETRLTAMAQERDDLLQEKASEASRARIMEMKASAAAAKCDSLQAEVNRLLDESDSRRAANNELSEEILQDARARLEMLHNSMGQAVLPDNPEVTRVLESLVADNEALKRDNAELQNMLIESREELRSLSEEAQEQRANMMAVSTDVVLKAGSPPSHPSPAHIHARRPNIRPSLSIPRGTHRPSESWAASFASSHSPPPYQRGFSRTTSPFHPSFPHRDPNGSQYGGGPLTEEPLSPLQRYRALTGGDQSPGAGSSQADYPFGRPLSPAGSTATSHTRHTASDLLYSNAYQTNFETDSGAVSDSGLKLSPMKQRKRALMLLSRSRGVQTDPEPVYPRPYAKSTSSRSISSGPGRDVSDTSSVMLDPSTAARASPSQVPPALPLLIDRLNALLVRVNQADVRTLTTRLKRQHIAGGDVGHLSQSTINAIMADAGAIRTHFRGALELERQEFTRKDLRGLLKFSKDVFDELGKLRLTVNDVTLDPLNAVRLRDQAQDDGSGDPSAATTAKAGKSAMGGWIAPISKLFTPTIDVTDTANAHRAQDGLPRSASAAALAKKRMQPPRVAPKLAPAVSSSATTVNVEFASSGTRRAVSSTTTPTINSLANPAVNVLRGSSGVVESSASGSTRSRKPRRDDSGLLGIFAGAPQGITPGNDWVVLPSKNKVERKLRTMQSSVDFRSGGTTGSSSLLPSPSRQRHRLSRNVDAVIDSMQQNDPSRNRINEDGEDADNQEDFRETLLEHTRTLRPRGLSDSSIHSTFLAAPVNRLLTPAALALSSPSQETDIPQATFGTYDRQSVMRALSRKVQSFATGYYGISSTPATEGASSPGIASPEVSSTPAASPPRAIPARGKARNGESSMYRDALSRRGSAQVDIVQSESSVSTGGGISSLLPKIASWAAAEAAMAGTAGREIGASSYVREDDMLQRPWGGRE